MLLPFSSYKLESSVSSQRLLNCYPEKAPEGAKGPLVLRRAPGIEAFATPGIGPGRGLHVMGGVLFALSGNSLYRISNAGVSTVVGAVPGTDVALMANNGTQMYLSPGYVYDGSVHRITDDDYTPGDPGSFFDNYLVLARLGTGRWYSSDLGDFETYDGLYFATAEGAPDPLIGIAVDHRQAVLIGTATIELWDNVGGTGFPFLRSPNGLIEMGGAATHAVTKQDQSVHWLANDLTLRRLSGNTAVRTSQHAMERAIRGYSLATIESCQMYSYSLDGHLNVVIRFPGVSTWVFDCTTGEIHERQTYGKPDWDVCGFAEAYGKVFVQRASDGAVGVLTEDCYEEFGDNLVASWTYQNLYNRRGMTVDRLDIGFQTGVGLTLGQGTDPRISLEVSTDGGSTYRQLPSRSLGEKGKYKHQVHWDKCGFGRDIVFRASVADPVPVTVWDTEATVR